DQRAGHRGGRDHPGVPAERVVPGVDVAGVVDDLRVGLREVVDLEEPLGGHLPVARHDLAEVYRLPPLTQRPPLEVPAQGGAYELSKRLRLRVEVDVYEAVPGVGQYLAQPVVAGIEALEVPLAGDVVDRPVGTPGRAVERSGE